jgi:hypothetical protein
LCPEKAVYTGRYRAILDDRALGLHNLQRVFDAREILKFRAENLMALLYLTPRFLQVGTVQRSDDLNAETGAQASLVSFVLQTPDAGLLG